MSAKGPAKAVANDVPVETDESTSSNDVDFAFYTLGVPIFYFHSKESRSLERAGE